MDTMFVVVDASYLDAKRDGNYLEGTIHSSYDKAEASAKRSTNKKQTDYVILQPIAQTKAVVPAIEVVKLNVTA